MLHVRGHEGIVPCTGALTLHVGAVIGCDVHLQGVLDRISDFVKTDFLNEVVKQVPRLGLARVLHLGCAGDEIVHRAGVNGVPRHVLGRVAHDGVAGGTGGHDVKSFGFSEGKIPCYERILQLGCCLLDDVAAVAARPWDFNELNVKRLAKRLNGVFNFRGTGSCYVSGVVCDLCHHLTSEPLVNFVEQTDHFVIVLDAPVEHLWNTTQSCGWDQESL